MIETAAQVASFYTRMFDGWKGFIGFGGADAIRRAFAADVGRDRLSLGIREEGGRLLFAFPVVVRAGSKPTQAPV